MLEEILKDMENYGKPNISKLDSGWHCSVSVKVFVTGQGIQFGIASEFGHQSALIAAQECHERMISAMRGVAEQTKRLWG